MADTKALQARLYEFAEEYSNVTLGEAAEALARLEGERDRAVELLDWAMQNVSGYTPRLEQLKRHYEELKSEIGEDG